jgi:serine/threonine protein kinase
MLNLHDLLYDRIGSSGVSLMRGMLDYDVNERFTASQCLQHEFFANSTVTTAAAKVKLPNTLVLHNVYNL